MRFNKHSTRADFFTATSAVKEQSMALFFIPGMVLVLASFSTGLILDLRTADDNLF